MRSSSSGPAVLTNGDVDHVAGLLTLRERHPLTVYATGRVLEVLAENTIFNVLNPEFVDRRKIILGESFEPAVKDGRPSGVLIEPFGVPGKVALYKENAAAAATIPATATACTTGAPTTTRRAARRPTAR